MLYWLGLLVFALLLIPMLAAGAVVWLLQNILTLFVMLCEWLEDEWTRRLLTGD